MSDDWESVTRIGSKVRGTGGVASDREKVVRGKSALNAAQRSGAIIGTEKKYGTTNAAKSTSQEGQFLTKVDRENDVVAVKTVGPKVGQEIANARGKMNPKLNRKQLGLKISVAESVIAEYELGTAKPDQGVLGKLERVLGVKLRGNNIGEPLTLGPKK